MLYACLIGLESWDINACLSKWTPASSAKKAWASTAMKVKATYENLLPPYLLKTFVYSYVRSIYVLNKLIRFAIGVSLKWRNPLHFLRRLVSRLREVLSTPFCIVRRSIFSAGHQRFGVRCFLHAEFLSRPLLNCVNGVMQQPISLLSFSSTFFFLPRSNFLKFACCGSIEAVQLSNAGLQPSHCC